MPGFTGSWSKIYDFPPWISQIGNIAENAHLHCNKDALLSELDGFKPSVWQPNFNLIYEMAVVVRVCYLAGWLVSCGFDPALRHRS